MGHFRSGLLITSFQAQTRSLFKIGSIPSGHHLKKRKASSHPQTQTGIRLVWTGQVQLADPNPIVQDWKHPVKAPSKETKGLEPSPNPNWHPSGLDRSSLQTQIQLFKIGSNQLRHHLKKRKASSHPQTQTGIRLVWSGQVQLADPNPIVQDWKQPVSAPSEENQRPRANPKPKLAPVWSGQVQLACRPRSNCSRLEASSQGTV